jgi:hypothetical protein
MPFLPFVKQASGNAEVPTGETGVLVPVVEVEPTQTEFG